MKNRLPKNAAITCVLCMVAMLLAACGSKEPKTPAQTIPESEISVVEETLDGLGASAQSISESEVPVTEETPEIPENYEEVFITNHRQAIQLSFFRPALNGWENENRSDSYSHRMSWRSEGDLGEKHKAIIILHLTADATENVEQTTTPDEDDEIPVTGDGFCGLYTEDSLGWSYDLDMGSYSDDARIFLNITITGASECCKTEPEVTELRDAILASLKVSTEFEGALEMSGNGYVYDETRTIKVATPIAFNGQSLEATRQHRDGFGSDVVVEYIDEENNMKFTAAIVTPEGKPAYESHLESESGYSIFEMNGYPAHSEVGKGYDYTEYRMHIDVNGAYYCFVSRISAAAEPQDLYEFLALLKMEDSPYLETAKALLDALLTNCTFEAENPLWFE